MSILSELSEAVVTAGIKAVQLHDTAEAISRRVIVAALRTWQRHAIAQGRRDIPREVGDLADAVEHPADQTRDKTAGRPESPQVSSMTNTRLEHPAEDGA